MDREEIVARLSRMEGKQDLMLDLMQEDRKALRAVEKKVWGALGTAVVAVGTAFMHKLGVPTA